MSGLNRQPPNRDQSVERLFLRGFEFVRLFLLSSLSDLEQVVTAPNSTTPSPAMHKYLM
jgi:hypothetical protein